MLTQFLHRRIAAFEREFSYDMGYGHEMLDISRKAFMRFARINSMAQHHKEVPLAVWYAAKLASTMAEDCGPCTQLVATMAEHADVTPRVLRAIIEGDVAAMDEEVGLGWRFARATLAHDLAANELREQIVNKWGQRAVVSLALAIASARVFPTIKYAMGHGQACVRVRIAGVETRPSAQAKAAGERAAA